MRRSALDRQRRLVGGGLLLAVWCAILWLVSPGLPVLWGPWASAATREAGRELFEHEWTANDPLAHGDGLGPVYNAKSCAACHFQGGVGGAGDTNHNVHNYAVMPSVRDGEFRSGTVHAASTEPALKESFDLIRRQFPVIKGGQRVEK